jgi:hypothetical protein
VGHILLGPRSLARPRADKNQAAADLAEKQVVANAKQIAGSIEPFYGKAATDQLFKLLAGHYTAIKAHATGDGCRRCGRRQEGDRRSDQQCQRDRQDSWRARTRTCRKLP